ncbi:MAG: archease [Gemmataceae bacterium]|nr:archease [Gemmataceae bacterium]
MFEFFEHTADLGLRARAESLNDLFAEGAKALFAAILIQPEEIQPLEETQFHLEEADPACLFRDWLALLLTHFEADKKVFTRFQVFVQSSTLRATARGEMFDAARHGRNHEVKAITYHGLLLTQADGQWLAEVIVDI